MKQKPKKKRPSARLLLQVIVVRSREALWLQREVGTAWFGSMAAGYSFLFLPMPMLGF